MVKGTWEGASGTHTWEATQVEEGFTLAFFSPSGEHLLTHGAFCPITINEARTGSSLVATIIREAFSL